MNPEELQNTINSLQEQIDSLNARLRKKELDDNKDTTTTRKVYRRDIDLLKTKHIYINSGFNDTSEIRFDYDEVGTPSQRKTIDRIYKEVNGGDLVIETSVNTTPKKILSAGESNISIGASHDEILLSATEIYCNGVVTAKQATTMPAGGAKAMQLGSSGLHICWGSGAPTLSATKGSLYLRSDGTGTSDRAYINTNGSTTWTALTTAA